MSDHLQTLVEAAALAPSGDNTQPWKFRLNHHDGTIHVYLNPNSDRSPMNAGQRMARIAIGAAIENMRQTAAANGWAFSVDTQCLNRNSEERNSALREVAVVRCWTANQTLGKVPAVLSKRVTNRRAYAGQEVSSWLAAILTRVENSDPAVSIRWIFDRSQRALLASLIGELDALMLGNRLVREAFLANVRFDQLPQTRVELGLPVGSLELRRMNRLALRLLPHLPQVVVNCSGFRRQVAAQTRRLLNSASGLCLITADQQPLEATDFHVGRSMQRVWLALTKQGLAVQPMMSLPVLQNMVTYAPELLAAKERKRLQALESEFYAAAQLSAEQRPAVLLRFGQATEPSTRAGRLPVAALSVPSDGEMTSRQECTRSLEFEAATTPA